MTALMYAAIHGSEEVVSQLGYLGADLDVVDPEVRMPVAQRGPVAARATSDPAAAAPAACTPNPAAPLPPPPCVQYGRTALMWAVIADNAAAAERLVQLGSDPDATDAVSGEVQRGSEASGAAESKVPSRRVWISGGLGRGKRESPAERHAGLGDALW